ncbi:unnamed protein product [Linum trigynum]|uniref:Uncharacterized protein n=1 Tax=Linum trigynum TaxID=586398 RepID=A0AAV2CMY4_9ROSI
MGQTNLNPTTQQSNDKPEAAEGARPSLQHASNARPGMRQQTVLVQSKAKNKATNPGPQERLGSTTNNSQNNTIQNKDAPAQTDQTADEERPARGKLGELNEHLAKEGAGRCQANVVLFPC